MFKIIFLRGCWEDLTKKHVFISRRETSRVSGIHLYDTLYALASLARGDSRALKGHITKDTIKIFKSLKSPKYPIILLFLLKNESVQNYFYGEIVEKIC